MKLEKCIMLTALLGLCCWCGILQFQNSNLKHDFQSKCSTQDSMLNSQNEQIEDINTHVRFAETNLERVYTNLEAFYITQSNQAVYGWAYFKYQQSFNNYVTNQIHALDRSIVGAHKQIDLLTKQAEQQHKFNAAAIVYLAADVKSQQLDIIENAIEQQNTELDKQIQESIREMDEAHDRMLREDAVRNLEEMTRALKNIDFDLRRP